MQQAQTTTGNKVIVGLGKTGLSCARYLHAAGESFSVVDSRSNPPSLGIFRSEFPGVELVLGGFPADRLASAAELIVSPGISLSEPAIAGAMARGVPVTGDIDIFSRYANAPIVAVTGSNGKSTVVTLVGEMARTAGIEAGVGGNLDGPDARPALDLLNEKARLYVLELSSFQLETTAQLNAEVAVILNLSEDHMDRYATMQEYLQAKQRIFRGCAQLVVNRDDPASAAVAGLAAKTWSYGLDAPGEGAFGLLAEEGEDYLAFGSRKLMPVSGMKLGGRHNVSNALAALALGHAVNIPMDAMLTTLQRFAGLPHRCQWVRRLNGVDFYNDSKGTNPGATVVAIGSVGELISGAVILIAGGLGKDADFAPLHPVVSQYVRAMILIGRDGPLLAAALGDATEIEFAESLQEAVQQAYRHSRPGDAVLLSPACASLDMFTDFTHRGRVFMDAVGALQ